MNNKSFVWAVAFVAICVAVYADEQSEVIVGLNGQVEALSTKVAALNGEIAGLQGEVVALKAATEEQTSAFSALEADFEACRMALVKSEQEVTDLESYRAKASTLADELAAARRTAEQAQAATADLQAAQESAKTCEARFSQTAAQQQSLESERNSLLAAELSLKAQLEKVQARLAETETHWLPIWSHPYHARVLAATEHVTRYYQEEVVTGKLYAAIRAKVLTAYNAGFNVVKEQSKSARTTIGREAAKFWKSEAGQQVQKMYDQAADHVAAARRKVQHNVDELLSHPEVHSKVQLVKGQAERVEKDLNRIMIHALKSNTITEPYAEEATARTIARALMYGMPMLVIMWMLLSCCVGGSSSAVHSTPQVASSAKPTSSAGKSKSKAKGQHPSRVPHDRGQ